MKAVYESVRTIQPLTERSYPMTTISLYDKALNDLVQQSQEPGCEDDLAIAERFAKGCPTADDLRAIADGMDNLAWDAANAS